MIECARIEFVTSALKPEEFPLRKNDQGKVLPEVALIGRSNVGKSSLLNVLFRKKIAKASATPGKTQRINFFVADKQVLFADLPGYGYSKAPTKLVAEWSSAIDEYLNHRPTLKLLLVLVDVRRGLSSHETSMLDWAANKRIPVLVIFTKTDTVSPNQLKQALETVSTKAIGFSKNDLGARKTLIRELNHALAAG